MALAQKKIYTEEDYYNIPEDVRAELINGQIFYQAAPSRIHQEILGELYTAINNYIKSNNGDFKVYPAPFAVKLAEDGNDIVEPDISVICDKNKLTDKGCTGAPDWIIEIVSPSNPLHDYAKKLELYTKAGVQEYWIVNPSERNVMVYRSEEEQLKVMPYAFEDPVPAGIYDDFAIRLADFKIEF